MNDPYQLTDQRSVPPQRAKAPSVVNTLLWIAMAVLVGLNAALSFTGSVVLSSVFGAGALVCLTIILVRYFGSRK